MILVDKPYISDFFKQTVREHDLPVIDTKAAREMGFINGNLVAEQVAAERIGASTDLRLYTTSENTIGWISRHLATTDLPAKIDLFKNKAKFRRLIASLNPNFFFKEVRLADLADLPLDGLPTPFIIKPTVGFFSMGVHKVTCGKKWQKTRAAIFREVEGAGALYPAEVMNTTSFIIEQYITGEEFAMDAYFDHNGQPVILNILQHVFASARDVSDRTYITSKPIIEENIEQFTNFLHEVGSRTGVHNFPVHVEIRRTADGEIIPIEINPMRFGGWCSTPDLAHFAYGVNPYLAFFSGNQPDWPEILKDKEGRVYSLIILNNSTGVPEDQITAFDYDRLLAGFERVLEFREIDFSTYPVFGFVFTESRQENFQEVERILQSDLREFITVVG